MIGWKTLLVPVASLALACHHSNNDVPAGSALERCANVVALNAGARAEFDSAPPTLEKARLAIEKKAALARTIPGGFAGVYVASDGRTVVLLTDTSQARVALPALVPPLHAMYGATISFDNPAIQPATWNFAQLYAWYRYFRRVVPAAD